MIAYARYAQIAGQTLRGPKMNALDEFRISMRVSPGDVELTRMNNGRYVTLMDLGRVGLAFRCGLLPPMVRRRWTPLVAAVSIRYRRSLRIGQAFDLVTRVAAFDEKYWYFDQRFESKGDVFAAAYVKALFHGPGGSVPTRVMLTASGSPELVSPPLPESMRLWLESEEAMRLASVS
ncbi:MAG: acyl-CoA thioesterase [Polyangiaceae bacterium]